MTPMMASSSRKNRADQIRARRQAADAPLQPAPIASDEDDSPIEESFSAPAYHGESVFARPVRAEKRNVFPGEGRQRRAYSRSSVSRRVTIPLNKQGAELQLSSLPFFQLSGRGASLVIAILCIGLLVGFTQLKVNSIQCEGISEALSIDINSVLALQGSPIFALDPVQLRESLTIAFPELSEVRISIGFPNEVNISAKERTPLFAWAVDDRFYLVDDHLMVYAAHPGDTLDSSLTQIQADALPPAASGLQQSSDIIEEIYDYVWPDPDDEADETAVLSRSTFMIDAAQVEALETLLLYKPENAAILYSGEHGFGWRDPQGWDAWFGTDMTEIEHKIAVYNAIVEFVVSKRIDPSLISVEYLHAPYFREE